MCDLVLHSPAGADPVVYTWPLECSDKHDEGLEIVDTIRWVCEDFPELKLIIPNSMLQDYKVGNHDNMKKIVDKYNKSIDNILQQMKRGKGPPKPKEWCSSKLLKHILQQVYNCSVDNAEKLNYYEPFSPEVYGETSYDLIDQMLNNVKFSATDQFIDLGSGVGQVVLQVAAARKLSICYGVEKAEVPSNYAKIMDKNFKKWMKFYGKTYSPYKLLRGDFLVPEHKDKLGKANIIFVNNFAFGPAVDHKLKERFSDLPDGTRIVSSKAFCSLNFRITDRNLTDVGTIMHVSELSPVKDSVSWSGKPVKYFVHEVDRSKLSHETEENFKTRSRRDLTKSLSNNTPNGTQEKVPESPDAVGPTTRRAWSDYCEKKKHTRRSRHNHSIKKLQSSVASVPSL